MASGWFDLLLVPGLAAAAAYFLLLVAGRKRKLPIAGKTIFITGCDSGYGFSLAAHAVKAGMRVVAGCYDAGGEGGSLLKSLGAHVLPLDLSRAESITAAIQGVKDQCAGAGPDIIEDIYYLVFLARFGMWGSFAKKLNL